MKYVLKHIFCETGGKLNKINVYLPIHMYIFYEKKYIETEQENNDNIKIA